MDNVSSPPRGIGPLVRFAFLMIVVGGLVGIVASLLHEEKEYGPRYREYDPDATSPAPVQSKPENQRRFDFFN